MGLLNKKNNLKSRRVNNSGKRLGPSYYGPPPKSLANSPFQKRPPLARSFKHFLARLAKILAFTAVIASLAFCLILRSRPKVVVSSNAYHSSTVYETAAYKTFKAIRNKTKPTLDKGGITNALKKQFPEIDSVKIEVPIISQIPTLRLNIATPTFNFSSNNNLYVVGSNGVVAGLSSQLAGASNLPSVIDQSGFTAELGKQVLGTEAVAFINMILTQCQRAGLKVQSLTLPAAAQELDLRVQNQPYFVKFYLGGNVLSQAGQYLAAKHKFDTENSQPEQYLDVRVEGKVFYK